MIKTDKKTKKVGRKMKNLGTKEWAGINVNIQDGCPNDCSYCYAKQIRCGWTKQIEIEKWITPAFRLKELESNRIFKPDIKAVMFPSTHDITDFNIEEYLIVSKKILNNVGITLIIVSKPRLAIIKRLCSELEQWKDRIVFRFTIGSISNQILQYWEPSAPALKERIQSIKYAYKHGYRTSTSCEPLLDMTPYKLVDMLLPFVTEDIWIGKMMDGKQRTKMNGHGEKYFPALAELEKQDWNAFEKYYANSKVIKWKNKTILKNEVKKNERTIEEIMQDLFGLEQGDSDMYYEIFKREILIIGMQEFARHNEMPELLQEVNELSFSIDN